MPAKQRISPEIILAYAYERAQAEGAEALSARKIAAGLGCSTQPIYDAFSSMEGLREEIAREATKRLAQAMRTRVYDDAPRFLCMGLAYIDFAREEPRLFRLITLSGRQRLASLLEIGGEGAAEEAEFLTKIWLFAHGIACVTAYNDVTPPPGEVRRLLCGAAAAFRSQMKGSGLS